MDRIDPDFRCHLYELIGLLDNEDKEWRSSRNGGGPTPDTIFFSIVG